MVTHRWLKIALCTIVGSLILIACRHTGSQDDTTRSYLYVQTAKSGSLVATDAAKGQYHLLLENVSPTTIYFSDRPRRDAGHESTRSFVAAWAAGNNSFAQDAPNAALDVVTRNDTNEVYVLMLKNPKLHEHNQSLSYDVTLLEAPSEELGFTSKRLSKTRQDKINFKLSALYIDDQNQRGACTASDISVAVHPGNSALWGKLNVCATKAWGNPENTASCLIGEYPELSPPCASCFGQMAHCAAQHCAWQCAFNHLSEGCQSCAYSNCQDPQTAQGFTLSGCTGLTNAQMPPPQKSS